MDRQAFNARELRKYYDAKMKGVDYKIFDPDVVVLDILKNAGTVLKREEIIDQMISKAGLNSSDRDLAGELVTEALKNLVNDNDITRVKHGHYKAN